MLIAEVQFCVKECKQRDKRLKTNGLYNFQ